MANYATWAAWSAAHPGAAAEIDEATFNLWITLASRLIDRITGWPDDVFTLSASTAYYFDGLDRRFLECPKPPYAISKVEEVTTRAVGSTPEVVDELDATGWIARTRDYPVDRALARIERLPKRRVWTDGAERWKVTGTWGFVTAAGETPPEIVEVAGKLVMLLAEDDQDGADGDALRRGFVSEFQTDNFRYKLAGGGGQAVPAGVVPGTLTGRTDIDGVLAMFRPAPRGGYGARPSSHTRAVDDTTYVWPD